MVVASVNAETSKDWKDWSGADKLSQRVLRRILDRPIYFSLHSLSRISSVFNLSVLPFPPIAWHQSDFCSASLFEAVDPEATPYRYVVRAEMAALSEVDLDTLAEIIQEVNNNGNADGTFAVAYRSLIQVQKGKCKGGAS